MSKASSFAQRPVPQMLAVIADFSKETFQAATLNQNVLAVLVKTMKDLKKHDGSHWQLLIPIARCVAHMLATTKDEASVKPHVEILCSILEQCLTEVKTLRQEYQISTTEQLAVVKGLMEELQYTIDSKPRTKYLLLETLFEPMANLIVSSFSRDIHNLVDVARVLNSMMSCVNRNLRINIRNAHVSLIEEMVALLLSCGDYEVQQGLTEVLLRLAPADERQAMGTTWFHANVPLINSFIKVGTRDFESECRCFVNLLNSNLGVEARVVTHPTEMIIMGSIKVYKPKTDVLKHLFADFNLGSLSLSFSFVRWDTHPASMENPVVFVRLGCEEVAVASLLGLDERLLQLTLSLQHPLSQLENTDLASMTSVRLVFKRRYFNIPRLLMCIYKGKIQIEESLLPGGSSVSPQLPGPTKRRKKVSEGVSVSEFDNMGSQASQSNSSRSNQSTALPIKEKTPESSFEVDLPSVSHSTLMSRHPNDIPPDVDSNPVSPDAEYNVSEGYPSSPPTAQQQTQDTVKRLGGRPQTPRILLNKVSCPETPEISPQHNTCPETPGHFMNKNIKNKMQYPESLNKTESNPQIQKQTKSKLSQKDNIFIKESVDAKVAVPCLTGAQFYGFPQSKSPVEATEPGDVQGRITNPETPSMQQQACLVPVPQASAAIITHEVVPSPVLVVRKKSKNTQSFPQLEIEKDKQDVIKTVTVDEVPSIQQASTVAKPKLKLGLKSKVQPEKVKPKPKNNTSLTLRSSKSQQQKSQPMETNKKTQHVEVPPPKPVLNNENIEHKKVEMKKSQTQVKDTQQSEIVLEVKKPENKAVLETQMEPILSKPGEKSKTINQSVKEQKEDKTITKTKNLEICTDLCVQDNGNTTKNLNPLKKTYGKKKNIEKKNNPQENSINICKPSIEIANTAEVQHFQTSMIAEDNSSEIEPSLIKKSKEETMWEEFTGRPLSLNDQQQDRSADLVTPTQERSAQVELQLFQEAAPSKLRLSRPKTYRASKRFLLPHLDFLQAPSPVAASDPLTPHKRRLFNPDSSEMAWNTVSKSRKVTSSPPRTTKSQQGNTCTMEINQNFQIQNSLHIKFNMSPKPNTNMTSVYSDFEEFDNDLIQDWGNKKTVPSKSYRNKNKKSPSKINKNKVGKVMEATDSEEIKEIWKKVNTKDLKTAIEAESTKVSVAKKEKIPRGKGKTLQDTKQFGSTEKGQKIYNNKNPKKKTEVAKKVGRPKKEVLRNKDEKNSSVISKLAAMWDESCDNLPELVVEKGNSMAAPTSFLTPSFLKEKYIPPLKIKRPPKFMDQSLINPSTSLTQATESLPAITSPFSSCDSPEPNDRDQEKPVQQPKTYLSKHKPCYSIDEQDSQKIAATSSFSNTSAQVESTVTSLHQQLRTSPKQAPPKTSEQQKPVNQLKTYTNKHVQAPKQKTKIDLEVQKPNHKETEFEKLLQKSKLKTKEEHNDKMHKIFFGDTNESIASKITQRKPRKQVKELELLQTNILSSQESVWALPKAAKGRRQVVQPQLQTKEQAEEKFGEQCKQSKEKKISNVVGQTKTDKKTAKNKTSGKLQGHNEYSENKHSSDVLKDKVLTANIPNKIKLSEANNETVVQTQNNAVKARGNMDCNKDKSPVFSSAISVKSVPTPLTIPESSSVESSPFFVEGTPMEAISNHQSPEPAMRDVLNQTFVPKKATYLKHSVERDPMLGKKLSQLDIAEVLAEPPSPALSRSSSEDSGWEPVKVKKKVPIKQVKRLLKKRPRPVTPQTSSDSEMESHYSQQQQQRTVLSSKKARPQTVSSKKKVKEYVYNHPQGGKRSGPRSNSTSLEELEDKLHNPGKRKKQCLDISLSPIMSDDGEGAVCSDADAVEEKFEQWPMHKLLNAQSLKKHGQDWAYLEKLMNLVQEWTRSVTSTTFTKSQELIARFTSMLGVEADLAEQRGADLEDMFVRQEKAIRYTLSTFEMQREILEQQRHSAAVVQCQTERVERRLNCLTQEASQQKAQLAERQKLLREELRQQDTERMLRNIRARLAEAML